MNNTINITCACGKRLLISTEGAQGIFIKETCPGCDRGIVVRMSRRTTRNDVISIDEDRTSRDKGFRYLLPKKEDKS